MKSHRTTPRLKAVATVLIPISFFAFCESVWGQQVMRLTNNDGQDISPVWDPRDGTLAYMRSAGVSGVPFNLYQVSTDTPGESVMATGPALGFGLANSPSWIGSTGFLGLEERAVFHEYLRFDVGMAPFTRTVNDGNDAAFTRLLSVPGGGGGGWLKFSRDGSTALWRASTSGGSGTQELRVGKVSDLTGQAANQVGTVIASSFHSSDQRYLWGAALSPDGTRCVLALPATGANSSGPATDLWLYNSDGSGTPLNLTMSAAAGIYNRVPDFAPDGNTIVFSRFTGVTGETWDLYQIDADGGNLTQITDSPRFSEYEPSVSPDGTRVAFRGQHIAGFEDTEPALPEGEISNANVYVMSLPRFEIHIQHPPDAPSTVVLSWNTRAGGVYQLHQSGDLETWVPDGEPVPGDGSLIEQTRSIDSGQKMFFRVEERFE